MPLLRYLADTNAISDLLRCETAVVEWFSLHPGQVAISTFTLAEMRRGIELKPDGKVRRGLERKFKNVLDDYSDAILVFDEAAAIEWGRLMAQAKGQSIPYEDSLIAAIARSVGLKVVTRNTRHFPACDSVDPWTGRETAAWQR